VRAAAVGIGFVLVVAAAIGCGARSGVGVWSEPDERAGSAGESALAGAGGSMAGTSASSGTSGTGGTGASDAGSGGTSGVPCGPLIDDMEDGDGRICRGEGRYGVWYAFNDGTGTQWPAPSSPGIPIEDEELESKREASARAMHTYGSGFSSWGAGIGLDFAFDGATYSTHAAGHYDGIVFYARSSAPLEIDVRISSQQTALAQYGGTCEREPCAPHSRRFAVEQEWGAYRVTFNDIPRGFSSVHPADFMRGALLNLQFMPADAVSPFDFWIDDVAFYRDRDCCASPPPGCEGDIAVPDPVLARRIRDAAGKASGPLRCDDVCNVSPLNASRVSEPEPIRDLGGVGCMTGLTELLLSYNAVTDLTPLAGLAGLRVLNLVGNQVVDVSPLIELSELRVLELWNNQIEDVGPLATLPKLESVSLFANRIVDVAPLAGATWLDSVDLGGNRIVDARPLAAAHLESVRLSHNRITDVGQFLAFEGVTWLDLTGNPIACESEAAELALLRQRVSVTSSCN
jgi:hypothetical protein